MIPMSKKEPIESPNAFDRAKEGCTLVIPMRIQLATLPPALPPRAPVSQARAPRQAPEPVRPGPARHLCMNSLHNHNFTPVLLYNCVLLAWLRNNKHAVALGVIVRR